MTATDLHNILLICGVPPGRGMAEDYERAKLIAYEYVVTGAMEYDDAAAAIVEYCKI